MGHVGYYHRFIENFTRIAAHLLLLLTKNIEFVWIDECQSYLETLKQNLSEALVFCGPN
jgi:hypothetical protein